MTDIDINEKSLYEKYPTVLDLLLLDNTTKRISFGQLILIKDADIDFLIIFCLLML